MSPDVPLDFIGIGVSRCATTWIADMLRAHPNIFIPERKELHYFNNRTGQYGEDLRTLEKIYPTASNMIMGEFTPRYILNDQALKRIKKHFPDIKLLVSLRDPLERALSQYRYFLYELRKENKLRFDEAIDEFYVDDYIKKSQYYHRLKAVHRMFKREQVEIIWFSDIIESPEDVLLKALDHIGASPFTPDQLERKTNASNTEHQISIVENTYRKYNENVRYRVNFRGSDGYRILQLLDRHKILHDFLHLSKPFFQFVSRLERFLFPDTRHMALSKPKKEQLYRRFFKEDVEQLEEYLNEDLTHWKY